jgi:hypothetical protein
LDNADRASPRRSPGDTKESPVLAFREQYAAATVTSHGVVPRAQSASTPARVRSNDTCAACWRRSASPPARTSADAVARSADDLPGSGQLAAVPTERLASAHAGPTGTSARAQPRARPGSALGTTRADRRDGDSVNETCDRCGPAVRAVYRAERAGDLYLCRHCGSLLGPALQLVR